MTVRGVMGWWAVLRGVGTLIAQANLSLIAAGDAAVGTDGAIFLHGVRLQTNVGEGA
jgi:hypothetical protein